MSIGLVIGDLLGCAIVVAFEPRYDRKLKEKHGIPVPERRLLPMMIGTILFQIELFWFAWTGNYSSISLAAPAVSNVFTGAGSLPSFCKRSASSSMHTSWLLRAASQRIHSRGASLFGARLPSSQGRCYTG